MSDFQLLDTLIFPDYIRRVMITKNRAPKYYEKGKKKVPEKYRNAKYGWRGYEATRRKKKTTVYYLVEITTGQRVVSNSRSAGTPRYLVINGQSFLNGKQADFVKDKVLGGIKDFFRPTLMKLNPVKVEDYPIVIELEFFDYVHDTIQGDHWDVGNRASPYSKALEDAMQEAGYILNDSQLYVTGPPRTIFTPILEGEPTLFVRVYSDKRPSVMENMYYKQVRNGNHSSRI